MNGRRIYVEDNSNKIKMKGFLSLCSQKKGGERVKMRKDGWCSRETTAFVLFA